ncbi:MAG: HlyD family secretion protein, partial [Quisquiliibacterium sp.]
QRAKVEAELQGVERQRLQYHMKAPFAGVVYFNNPDMLAGDWVGKNEKLGELIGPGGWRVETYLSEADIQRLRVGDSGVFFSESGHPAKLAVRVESIDQDATHELSEAMLASTRGGALPVREHAKALVPEHAVYRVVLNVPGQDLPVNLPTLRGQVVIHGDAQSWLSGYLRAGLAVIRREAGF